MLVAYGPGGQAVIAEEGQLEQLQRWSRERVLYCPNCRGIVHVRGGPERRTHLHFAHQRGECAWSTEAESVRHARGKMVIASWLRGQFPQATITLEERLPEPNRIADIFLTHPDGQRWAIEFQCAPLELHEWQHRHRAYQQAGITDLWIIGDNRREKQEAFIEAVIVTAREVLFLDPQVTPSRAWLRWPVARQVAQEWQQMQHEALSLEGWVGRPGYAATLTRPLSEVHLDERAYLVHPVRTSLEAHIHLKQSLQTSSQIDASLLAAYLRLCLDERTIVIVIMPLLRAYLRDPDLLRRYNYGRGLVGQPVSKLDEQRIHKAQGWLQALQQNRFSLEQFQEIAQALPFIGPYAPFAKYAEMLFTLA